MTAGDFVVYLADPLLHGKMVIVAVTEDARLLCEAVHADKDGNYAREIFDATELELAAKWAVA